MAPSATKHALVKLEGEMTIFNARPMADRLLSALPECVGIEVDLSGVTEIDSAGLQIMIAAKALAGQAGKPLVFTGHSPAVQDMLDLTDLAGFFGDPIVIEGGAG